MNARTIGIITWYLGRRYYENRRGSIQIMQQRASFTNILQRNMLKFHEKKNDTLFSNDVQSKHSSFSHLFFLCFTLLYVFFIVVVDVFVLGIFGSSLFSLLLAQIPF